MRKDPPVDAHFLNAVHLLGFAEREGVLVVNPTRALLECNEKLFAQQFPQCCTPTLVACSEPELRAFHAEHQDVRSEEHTSELQSRPHLVCRLLLEKKKT